MSSIPHTNPLTTSFTSNPTTTPFTVPAATYLKTHYPSTTTTNTSTNPTTNPTNIAVGALLFNPPPLPKSQSQPQPKILLLQRSPADTLPNLWEIPGGACDVTDRSILHSVVRELHEETGLTAREIGLVVREQGYGFSTSRGLRVLRFDFLVNVDFCGEVRLEPSEHQAFCWAGEEDVRNGRCGDVELRFTSVAQKEIILEGFELWTRMVENREGDERARGAIEVG